MNINEMDYRKRSRIFPDCDGDEIVITGMSGKFPNSENIAEFEYNLYNKIDMIDNDSRRWDHFNDEIPRRSGKLKAINKFDATFFGINWKQANSMDPQCRIVIEAAYEAVLDSGINPGSLRGTNTGVFIGVCSSDAELTMFTKMDFVGFGITGCSRAMLANRISYILGLNGPSFSVDTACSSSMTALDNAFTAIRNHEIDAAIVGGTNITLDPYVTLQFSKLGVLASDGYCRPFDNDGSGYTRAEAISCIFLQRKKNANRIYANLVYSKINSDGFKQEGITYPSGKVQEKLLMDFYDNVKISPAELGYLEAHGTGTIVGDPEECRAIDKVICSRRNSPLPIGSVKSNIGHTEGASGICSIVKAILTFQNGKISPNINFTKARKDIIPLTEGRLKVINEITDLQSPYIGINSFGFGGSNAHILLKAHEKEKTNFGIPLDDLPRLVNWSTRSEEGLNCLIDSLKEKPLDAEYVGLLQNIQKQNIPGLTYRGFGLLTKGVSNSSNAKCLARAGHHYTGLKRPIVWVFSGMGSQWTSMGKSIMGIPFFQQSIQRCHNALKPFGLHLIDILTSNDPTIYDNILHCFVGIAAMQIALVDILRLLEIEPDFIIGHSVGELGCAYADSAFTTEQMILAAYYRGKVSLEAEKIKGSMAAIGMSYEQIHTILPETIEVACHNSSNSCTISGPADDVDQFVKTLSNNGVFAKEVPCSNIAYHSKYIAHFGPRLLKYLKQIIPTAKPRSSKWFSTSVPKNKWNNPENNLSSAEYHTNNLLSSVLFEETFKLLPDNALTIEIAPHGLLQAILKQSKPSGEHIGLTQRGNKSNVSYFLTALGRLYINGLVIPIEKLYPKINFPVSKGTPTLSSLIKWDHSTEWFTVRFGQEQFNTRECSEKSFAIGLKNNDINYLRGHKIDGRVLVPATFYLEIVWETYARLRKQEFSQIAVEFQDVKFVRATTLMDKEVFLIVVVNHGSGKFEITTIDSEVVVTGTIRTLEQDPHQFNSNQPIEDTTSEILLSNDGFYKELKLRGYHYADEFKSVQSSSCDGLNGKIMWKEKWVSFMDCMLQMQIIGRDSRALLLPTRIRRVRIWPKYHMELMASIEGDKKLVNVSYSSLHKTMFAGGIEITGLIASSVQRRKPPGIPVLEKYTFLPQLPSPNISKSDAIRICIQIGQENYPNLKINIIEEYSNGLEPIMGLFQDAIEDLPLISGDFTMISEKPLEMPGVTILHQSLSLQMGAYFVVVHNILKTKDFYFNNQKCTNGSTYLLSRETSVVDFNNLACIPNFKIVAMLTIDGETLILFQREPEILSSQPICVHISESDQDFKWIKAVQNAINENKRCLIIAENEKLCGIIGLINCLRKEPGGKLVSCLFIDDMTAPKFDLAHPFYSKQLDLGLAMNIYRNGKWGSYRHLKISSSIQTAPRNNHIFGNIMYRGDLASLGWFEGPFNEKDIKIVYSSLNFKDIMLATGRLSVDIFGFSRMEQNNVLGFEYSGIEIKTKRPIMGMAVKGCVANYIEMVGKLSWYVPSHWSLRDAATVPVVYITVYYAFFITTDIRKGRSILIHAGSGGIGLAAIRVALAYGLDVYTTVSTAKKRSFLLQAYPQLKDSHIGNSRDISFESMIYEQTYGRGVDFVLNSLSEDKLLASIRCLAKGGKFLEIGKFDMASNNKIGLGEFLNELTFHAVLADNLITAEDCLIEEIKSLIETDIKKGIIQPLPSTVFPAKEIEQAFRHLIGGRHIGKVLIQLHENESAKYSLPVRVVPQIYFEQGLVYIVPGGLGGFGLELVDWMIIRGARKIVLSSSRGITSDYQSYRISVWKGYGCQIAVSTSNITTKEGCQTLLEEAIKLGDVGGIFNLAVILKDAAFTNQTVENFKTSFAPKAIATKYLDDLSRILCPRLHHFMVFSSVSCGRGNAGQSNYGMSNSVMERIIENRVADGFPGKAIQWGAVGEVGLVAVLSEDKIDLEISGTLQQRISSCLRELDVLISSPDSIVSSMVVAEKRTTLGGTQTAIEAVMNILGVTELKSVSLNSPLSEMGLDSLMAIEVKQILETNFELFFTPVELRNLTFQKLLQCTKITENKLQDNENASKESQDRLGLNDFYKNVCDEEMSKATMVQLQTKDKLTNQNAAIILPGIIGLAGSYIEELGSQLNIKTSVIQYYSCPDQSSFKSMANYVLKTVKEEIGDRKIFRLIGYSYGSMLTLHIAKLLENDGYIGKLLIIDGSFDLLKTLLPNGANESIIYDMSLSILISQNASVEVAKEIIPLIMLEKNIKEKLNIFFNCENGLKKHSMNYISKILSGLVTRSLLIQKDVSFEVFEPINAPIHLIKPTIQSTLNMTNDYGLSKLTRGNILIETLEGNHSTVINSPQLPQIINNFCQN